MSLLGDSSGAHDIRTAALFDAAAVSVDIAAAILAILLVRHLTARQLERKRVLERLPAPAPSPAA